MRPPTFVLAAALAVATLGAAPPGDALGPGGWDRLGSQVLFNNPAASLNGDVMVMNTDVPGLLIAGGKFTNAGGGTGVNRIAIWNGTSWSGLGAPGTFNGDVLALAVVGGKVYAGGSFTNAGGDSDADFLAVWDGASWKHACTGGGAPVDGNVHALQVVGGDLYVGGSFSGVGGVVHTGALFRCNLATGMPTSTTVDPVHFFNGVVYALAADGAGNLYAGGGFSNVENNPASDNVVELPLAGVWTNLGSGGGACLCAVDDFVRALTVQGTSLIIGTDASNVAGIAQADHIAGWNGTSWHALGANPSGTDGYVPGASTPISALFASGGHVYASGSWTNVGGDPTADFFADFDGSSWKPVGSNGAGDGALTAKAESIAIFNGVLHVGGNFTKAGGDNLASFIARYTGVPNSAISVGKPKSKTSNGTAKLPVTVPGAGVLALAGKGVKGVSASAASAGAVQLKVKATGKTAKKLKAKGKVKVTVTVTFTPTGGFAHSETVKVKLVRKT